MSQQCSQVTLCRKGWISCLPGMGNGVQLDWRGTSCRRRGSCATPRSQGFPAPGRALSTRPVSLTSPKPRPLGLVLAVGDADPGPGMGQDVCVPPRVSAVGCNQPCDGPTVARSPCPHLQPLHSMEHLPCMAEPSLLEHLQPAAQGKESQRAHSCGEGVLQLCQVQLSSPGLRAPQDKSVSLGTRRGFSGSSSLQRCGSRTCGLGSLWRQYCYSCS